MPYQRQDRKCIIEHATEFAKLNIAMRLCLSMNDIRAARARSLARHHANIHIC